MVRVAGWRMGVHLLLTEKTKRQKLKRCKGRMCRTIFMREAVMYLIFNV